ncbi:MAG: zinc metallopeptidase [Anaerolineales bacterium]|nr:zinc metallopeptidase [Anaerolineales bacterium]MCB0004877.1 zinc metallopeptidase [Anaerolineales bacterium]MCB0016700.1 zinc metallopeptidase [Anaerolineales bacterium]MCB0026433.1 zinc metallopeptidase [Anaerolineales bacterium]MCB8961978.1 zinc metallopeptidase [Ardenticatenales bacterium]
MYFSPLYFIFALPPLLLALYAQSRVRSAYNKYSRVATTRGLTGAQVARALLDARGLYDVGIEASNGFLSDHYDPRSRTLRLSPDVYNGQSVAAAGIAAHEMGHALQDQVHYVPLKLRSGLVPAAQFGSRLGPMLFMGGLFLSVFSSSLLLVAWAGLILFAIAAVFTIITLPVEFNASKRAKELLVSENVLYQNEMTGVNKVLDAAALTYVAAAAQSISLVLYYAMILLGGGRRR